MKFSKQWIQEYVNLSLNTSELVDLLTMAGLEVDSTETMSPLLGRDTNPATEPDTLFDIELTPNRGDCLSIKGVARELAVLTQQAFKVPARAKVTTVSQAQITISNNATEQCPRYVGRLIKGVDNKIPTPLWLVDRLNRVGLRPISLIVDILNYVMIEIGQPMHAFDATAIQGGITIRLAHENETIILLDERKIALKANTLVIADDKEALAIAGIMGGISSGVTENTTDIFLESALFLQSSQLGAARQYGLQTDSSYRFERGVDPNLQSLAIERASELISDICVNAKFGPIQEYVETKYLPKKQKIFLRPKRAQQLLGFSINAQQAYDCLTRIGCQCELVEAAEDGKLQVLPPSHRYDLNLEIDLIEELARIYGYQNIKTELPAVQLIAPQQDEETIPAIRIKQVFVDLGYQEVINYSFVDNHWQNILFADIKPIELINPISQDMGVMRVSLLPGLFKVLQYNQRRQQNQLMIFELGDVYHHSNGKTDQTLMLSGLCVGSKHPNSWCGEKKDLNFFDVKGHLSAVWQLTRNEPLTMEKFDCSFSQADQSVSILANKQKIGTMGKLNTSIQKRLDIEGDIYWFECQVAPFLTQTIPSFKRPSKFPEIRRDIAIIVDQTISSQVLVDYVARLADKWLEAVHIFDEYKGKNINNGRKSIALGLILQHPSRTLIDDEINVLMQTIIEGLQREFSAELRE